LKSGKAEQYRDFTLWTEAFWTKNNQLLLVLIKDLKKIFSFKDLFLCLFL